MHVQSRYIFSTYLYNRTSTDDKSFETWTAPKSKLGGRAEGKCSGLSPACFGFELLYVMIRAMVSYKKKIGSSFTKLYSIKIAKVYSLTYS